MRRPSASELFYDPWNVGFFQGIAKSQRKNKNQSTQRLVKEFMHKQQLDNCFAFTQKKKILRRQLQ
jgi:hypothetical protein